MLAVTFTKANPPGSFPTMTLAKLINRMAIPPLFIMLPARIKKGIARRAKLSRPVAIRCEKVVKAARLSIEISIVNIPDIPMLKAIGTPITSRIKKLDTRTKIPV